MESHGNVNSWCDKFFDNLFEQLLDNEELWYHHVFSTIREPLPRQNRQIKEKIEVS